MSDGPNTQTGAVSVGRASAEAPPPEPTPVIPTSASTHDHPPGSAAPAWIEAWRRGEVVGPPDKPELAVGAAFGGAALLAILLRLLGR